MRFTRMYMSMFGLVLLICISCKTESKHASETVCENPHYGGELCTTDDRIYFISASMDPGSRRIMCYDKTSEMCNVLCGIPGCGHDSSDCNGVVASGGSSAYGLGVLNDKIYWLEDTGKENGAPVRCIVRMNPDGTSQEVVRQVESADPYEKIIADTILSDYIDDYLVIGVIVLRKEENTNNERAYLSLRAYSLTDPEKDITILDEAAYGNLYFVSVGIMCIILL